MILFTEAAEVAVVEEDVYPGDTTPGGSAASHGYNMYIEDTSMPNEYNMTISLIQAHVQPVKLKLTMNREMNEQRAIYVIKKGVTGKPKLTRQDVPIDGVSILLLLDYVIEWFSDWLVHYQNLHVETRIINYW